MCYVQVASSFKVVYFNPMSSMYNLNINNNPHNTFYFNLFIKIEASLVCLSKHKPPPGVCIAFFSVWWSYSYIPCCYIWAKQKCSKYHAFTSSMWTNSGRKKRQLTTTTQLDSRAGGQICPQPFSGALMGGKWSGQHEGHTDYSPMFSPNCHSP